LRKVVSEMYFCPAIGEGTWLAIPNIVAGLRPARRAWIQSPRGIPADVAGSQVVLQIALIV
jgi:hypothetical protein